MKGTTPLFYLSDHYYFWMDLFDIKLCLLFLVILLFLIHSLIVILYLILLYVTLNLLPILYNYNSIALFILNNNYQEFDSYLFCLVTKILEK